LLLELIIEFLSFKLYVGNVVVRVEILEAIIQKELFWALLGRDAFLSTRDRTRRVPRWVLEGSHHLHLPSYSR